MTEYTEPTLDKMDTTAVGWRKSSYSNGAGGMCVEIADIDDGVLVRDSKNPSGPVLTFTDGEWEAFLAGVRDGEFDRS
ncbi:DUF397 domain-containing protein [Protofrankia symbiont of Coriaria ruscifolia]|uniref:DUF397 domain-containing protein n=1 Tax=Candidatus Protofrankia californiensis TaxID=1839754 RepID=A0A1C3PG88_9ACTN|nr:DUF397 domain-containing protein [Protofrankia symbiont of Coriaria ruscifolia]SBW28851.1 hypothetical protein FDG2_6086 [Candidatus Protofrankia californiensis]